MTYSCVNYTITVPKDAKIPVELGIFSSGELIISGLTDEVELDVKTTDIELKEVTGLTVISSFSGDIEAVFSSLNQSSPFSIKAISGDIFLRKQK